MAREIVDALVEGGKASAAPPLGPALGPMGVNIGQVVQEINKKTEDFKGMKVPVKVIIDKDTKTFDITVGTPPASALIKKEARIEKAASNPLTEKVADLRIEQIIKIAKMKKDSLLGKGKKERVLEILGTCQSMGILVGGKPAHETILDIKNNNMYATEIEQEKTELSEEELRIVEEEKKRLQAELEKKRVVFELKAKELLKTLSETATTSQKRNALSEAKIPQTIIDQLAPAEKEVPGAAAAGQKK